jgi:hypothetical protein
MDRNAVLYDHHDLRLDYTLARKAWAEHSMNTEDRIS